MPFGKEKIERKVEVERTDFSSVMLTKGKKIVLSILVDYYNKR